MCCGDVGERTAKHDAPVWWERSIVAKKSSKNMLINNLFEILLKICACKAENMVRKALLCLFLVFSVKTKVVACVRRSVGGVPGFGAGVLAKGRVLQILVSTKGSG